jgi:hypothetical protein
VALEEFFGQELEIDYPVLIDEHHLGLPTVHLETDFSRPLRYGDSIDAWIWTPLRKGTYPIGCVSGLKSKFTIRSFFLFCNFPAPSQSCPRLLHPCTLAENF